MPYQQHQPWDHFPLHLSLDMISDPYAVIKEFFDVETDILATRKELKQWWRSAFSKHCLLSKPAIVSLIGFHDQLLKLIDTVYIIYEREALEVNKMEDEQLLNTENFCGRIAEGK